MQESIEQVQQAAADAESAVSSAIQTIMRASQSANASGPSQGHHEAGVQVPSPVPELHEVPSLADLPTEGASTPKAMVALSSSIAKAASGSAVRRQYADAGSDSDDLEFMSTPSALPVEHAKGNERLAAVMRSSISSGRSSASSAGSARSARAGTLIVPMLNMLGSAELRNSQGTSNAHVATSDAGNRAALSAENMPRSSNPALMCAFSEMPPTSARTTSPSPAPSPSFAVNLAPAGASPEPPSPQSRLQDVFDAVAPLPKGGPQPVTPPPPGTRLLKAAVSNSAGDAGASDSMDPALFAATSADIHQQLPQSPVPAGASGMRPADMAMPSPADSHYTAEWSDMTSVLSDIGHFDPAAMALRRHPISGLQQASSSMAASSSNPMAAAQPGADMQASKAHHQHAGLPPRHPPASGAAAVTASTATQHHPGTLTAVPSRRITMSEEPPTPNPHLSSHPIPDFWTSDESLPSDEEALSNSQGEGHWLVLYICMS